MVVPTRQFNEGLIIYIQLFFHTGQCNLAKLSAILNKMQDYSWITVMSATVVFSYWTFKHSYQYAFNHVFTKYLCGSEFNTKRLPFLGSICYMLYLIFALEKPGLI